MDSVTKGSGIAVSVLVAATASVLLLVPGHSRAGYWQGTGTARGGMVISAAAAPAGPGGWRPAAGPPGRDRPAAGPPGRDRPAAGPRPACRAAGAPGGRARPGVTVSGQRGGGPAAVRRGSCQAPGVRRHQESWGRLARYHGIGPDLP